MTVFLYILNTLSDWEISYLLPEINSGRYLKKSIEKPNIIKVGKDLNPITTMGGIKIVPDVNIANINIKNGDIMILPGADTWLDGTNNEILNFAEQNIDKNIIIAAICGATIALAYKGLLDKRKHTSNDLGFLKTVCPNYKGEMYYCNQLAVTENNLITASGIAPLEFTCEVIKKLNIMEKTTIEAWYNLYRTKESKYFFELMDSLK